MSVSHSYLFLKSFHVFLTFSYFYTFLTRFSIIHRNSNSKETRPKYFISYFEIQSLHNFDKKHYHACRYSNIEFHISGIRTPANPFWKLHVQDGLARYFDVVYVRFRSAKSAYFPKGTISTQQYFQRPLQQ